jgi:hypothetical protein
MALRPPALPALLIVIPAALSPALAQEQKIACDSVPAFLRSAFARTYPAATPTECGKEIAQNRTTSYEITGLEGRTSRKAVFAPDGKVISLEESLPLDDVPASVQQAVRTRFPDAVITTAEKVTYPAPAFELYVRHRGKLVQVEVDPNGRQVREVND